MESNEHLGEPMVDLLTDFRPSIVDVPEADKSSTRGEQRMEQPQGFADPLEGRAIPAFSLAGGGLSAIPAPAGYVWDHAADDFSDLPDEVAALFTKVEQDEYFVCTPQRQLPNGALEDCLEYKSYRPTRDEIGTRFGPGTYRYSVTYRPKNWTRSSNGRSTTRKDTPFFTLSEEGYRLKHEEYMAAQQELTQDRLRLKRNMNAARHGGEGGNAIETLMSVAQVLKTLTPPPPPPTNGMDGLLPMIMKMGQDSADRSTQMMVQMTTQMAQSQAQAQAAQVQSQTQMMTMMMTMVQAMMQMGNESTNRIVGLLGNTNKDGSLAMFKEFRQFVTEGISASRAATVAFQGDAPMSAAVEEREDDGGSLVATILSAIPTVIQSLSMLNAVPAPVRGPLISEAVKKEAGPQGQAAYNAMKNDQITRIKSMIGFVRQYGAEQLPEVLDAMLVKYTPEELAKAIELGEQLRAKDEAEHPTETVEEGAHEEAPESEVA